MSTAEIYTTIIASTEQDEVVAVPDQVLNDQSDKSIRMLRHPLGVRPSGNALTSKHTLHDAMGSWGRLPDEMILSLLEWLDVGGLISLGNTCRAFFAYTAYDQLWRELAVAHPSSNFQWRGSWRASVRRLPHGKLPKIECRNLFSDALHRPFVCSQINLTSYALDIPWSNSIPRIADLSRADFDSSWSRKPFILTDAMKKWKVLEEWDPEALLTKHGDTIFRAEAVDWPMSMYFQYMNETEDESPLYLFDRGFVEKMQLQVGGSGDYAPPECFQEDLFTVLEQQRPDHRWLIIGPERSGSTFHKDPNSTSAWNAVIRGSKYWIMFPPSILPPGVHMSEDEGEVTSPLSIAEWLLTFHEEARRTPGCQEGVCREGEVLHVPSGWWHLVVNLEPAIAITQNFVPRSSLDSVIHFLRNKADQVSGFATTVKDAYALFEARLKESYPDLIAETGARPSKKRKWEEVVENEEREGKGGFAFGFGDDDLEDDEE
ncbi:hypothetical protein DV736_g18, partial [Chaetothyriales sp. CBS 134916]